MRVCLFYGILCNINVSCFLYVSLSFNLQKLNGLDSFRDRFGRCPDDVGLVFNGAPAALALINSRQRRKLKATLFELIVGADPELDEVQKRSTVQRKHICSKPLKDLDSFDQTYIGSVIARLEQGSGMQKRLVDAVTTDLWMFSESGYFLEYGDCRR